MGTLVRRYFLLLILTCAAIASVVAQVLTQQDVIKLLGLKIPEQTIIDKVKSSGTAFVLGADDVARLKKAGATDTLIAAMQSSASTAGAGSATSEITDLALIVDYSGSMNAKMKDGATKVASAKRCVNDLIDKLPNDLNVALVVYGTSKKRGCEDIDIAQPLGPIEKASLKTKIDKYNATGMTPIATSLTKAGEELKKAKGGSGIVLVTDGAESCHGDPAGVAAKLAAEFGTKFGINVIGFGIEPQEKKQLADIADKGHGKLLTVENASELAGALQKVVAEKVAPAPKQRETKQYEAGGAAVKPGVFFGDAPATQPGDFKGTLAMKEAKYYRVDVRKGQEVRAIGIIQKTPYEASNSNIHQTFVISIYNKELAQVAREKMEIEGNPRDPASLRATWTADLDGAAYIAIAASDNHDPHDGAPVAVYPDGAIPNPSPYTLKIKIEGESVGAAEASPAIARSEKAGGSGFNSATELAPPTLTTTDLKIGETAFYKFPVKKGDVVQAAAAVQKPWYRAGNGAIKASYALTLYDDDQVQVTQKKIDVPMNPPDAQTLSVTWPATMSGNAYLSVSVTNTGEGIYPADFQPSPGRLSIQVTTEGSSLAPSEAEKPAQTEKTEETPRPAESPKPTQTPTNPFAGAESTPG
jgi:Mg-chelatase subunit ChlD